MYNFNQVEIFFRYCSDITNFDFYTVIVLM